MAVDADLFTAPDDFGEVVAWTKKDGTVIPALPLLLVLGQAMVGGQLTAIETEATAMVAAASVTPAAGDSFTRASGEVWKIDRTCQRTSDGVHWRIHVVSSRLAVLGGN
ncbi:MAG: hypothetical protein WC869_17075 [Phycisphaerae bacterium]